MADKYKFIDLFAGCGGLEDGFLQTGRYTPVASVEWLKPQVETLRNRLKTKWEEPDADEKVLYFDIQREEELFSGWNKDKDFGDSKGLDFYVNRANGVDLIIGGPPCQAYSIAGRVRDEHGMHDDYRNYLFEHYLNVVDRYRPKVFVFENVPGILSAKPNGVNIINEITASFNEIGYIISDDIRKNALINSAEYGVPQNRKRVIILGIRSDLDSRVNIMKLINEFYSEILPKYKSKHIVTVKEAIGDLKEFIPIWDEESHKKRMAYVDIENDVNWHKPRYHNTRDMKIYSMLAKDIETGECKYTDSKVITEIYEKIVGSKSPIHRYHVLKPDEPSTTIIAHLYKDGNRFIHYDSKQARSITPREAARLQSFDDDFEFLGTQGNVFQMIGNAVPPKLGYALGMAAYEMLNKIDKKEGDN